MVDVKKTAALAAAAAMVASAMAVPALAEEKSAASEEAATQAEISNDTIGKIDENGQKVPLIFEDTQKQGMKIAAQQAAKTAYDAADGGPVAKMTAGVKAALKIVKGYQEAESSQPEG